MLDFIVIQMSRVNGEKGYRGIKERGLGRDVCLPRLVPILSFQFFAVVTTTQTSRYEQTASIVRDRVSKKKKKKRWMSMNLIFRTDSKITLWFVPLRFQHIRQQ